MTSDLEQLVLAEFDFNDQDACSLEALSFKPAEAKPQWAGNADADGEELVEEPHYTNAYFDLEVRVEPAKDTDAALKVVGELLDKLQACARTQGGLPLEWTPNNSTRTYTWYATLGELTELPITVDGELAGWFIDSPVLKVKLTCRPFGYREERTVLESVGSGAEPLQVAYVGEIESDVPAEAELLVTDAATQDRRYLVWGRDLVTGEEGNPASLLVAKDFETEGFTGSVTTRSGAYSEEKVVRGTAISQATTLCSSGVIADVGSFRMLGRFYSASSDARVRLVYRSGDGPLIPLDWKELPVAEGLCQVDLGEVTFAEAKLGEQRSEYRIEIKSTGANCTVDFNYAEHIPTGRGYGVARGIGNPDPTTLHAYDEFEQAEGSLSGKELGLGGKWSGAGDAVDFKVIAAEDLIKRELVEDSPEWKGRYAIAGSTAYAAAQVSATLVMSSTKTLDTLSMKHLRGGLFLRYQDTENWVMATISGSYELKTIYGVASAHPESSFQLLVFKSVAGTVTCIGTPVVVTAPVSAILPTTVLTFTALANGVWWATATGSYGTKSVSGQDSDLATGGALAEGKPGIYAEGSLASKWNCVATFDSFSTLGIDPAGVVCYSGRRALARYSGFTRQDSSGTYYGPASLYRGANFFLDPAGSSGRVNRLVAGMRRNDVVEEEDANVTDKQSLKVVARERFLTPR